jgi:phage terminase small subunit
MAQIIDENYELDAMDHRFIAEYLVDMNGTKAALRAGFVGTSAADWAYRRLKHPVVQRIVRQSIDDAAADAEVRIDKILKELAAIGFSNIQDFIDSNGQIDLEVDSERFAAVESVSIHESESEKGRQRSTRIKMHNKLGALEKMAKYLGAIQDKVEVDHTNSDKSLSPIQKMSDEELRAEALARGLPGSVFGS